MRTLKAWIILFGMLMSLDSYSQISCDKLPLTFVSDSKAIKMVKDAKFPFKETINTNKSDWIKSASFYSCDNIKGLLLINLNNRIYIHQAIPMKLWNLFKNSNSYGSFYNKNIRNKYGLLLGNSTKKN